MEAVDSLRLLKCDQNGVMVLCWFRNVLKNWNRANSLKFKELPHTGYDWSPKITDAADLSSVTSEVLLVLLTKSAELA